MAEAEAAEPLGLGGPLISQGAEARVFQTTFCGRPAVVKQRFKKNYRHPLLDAKLTLRRLHGEARSMLKADRLGVRTPAMFAVDSRTCCIVSEFIEGPSVKTVLLETSPGTESLQEVAELIGRVIARLHDGGLIHGDLTTSNMLLRKSQGGESSKDLVLIDFGLSHNSTLAEDKAVDLYVLERALLSLHSAHEGLMEAVLKAYKRSSKYWSATHNKLADVRMRGRKRVMVG